MLVTSMALAGRHWVLEEKWGRRGAEFFASGFLALNGREVSPDWTPP